MMELEIVEHITGSVMVVAFFACMTFAIYVSLK